jgi:hypothetical protein
MAMAAYHHVRPAVRVQVLDVGAHPAGAPPPSGTRRIGPHFMYQNAARVLYLGHLDRGQDHARHNRWVQSPPVEAVGGTGIARAARQRAAAAVLAMSVPGHKRAFPRYVAHIRDFVRP